MNDLFFEGKKYISSKRAAQLTGYASDYIGQLCRDGKVLSKMVGRSWYVSVESILDHQQSYSAEQNEIISPVVVSTIEVIKKIPEALQIPKNFPLGKPTAEIKYSEDTRPLLPTLSKRDELLPLRVEMLEKVAQATPQVVKLHSLSPETLASGFRVISHISPTLVHKATALALSFSMVFGIYFAKEMPDARVTYRALGSEIVRSLDEVKHELASIDGKKFITALEGGLYKAFEFAADASEGILRAGIAVANNPTGTIVAAVGGLKNGSKNIFVVIADSLYNGVNALASNTKNLFVGLFSSTPRVAEAPRAVEQQPIAPQPTFVTAQETPVSAESVALPGPETLAVEDNAPEEVPPTPSVQASVREEETVAQAQAQTPREESVVLAAVTHTEFEQRLFELNQKLGMEIYKLGNRSGENRQSTRVVVDAVDTGNLVGSDLNKGTIRNSTITSSSFSGTSGSFSEAVTMAGNLSVAGQLSVSGTATSTVAGDVSFSNGTLYVDSINHRIGIGTTSPFATLAVAGNAYFEGGTVNAATITATSTITATNFIASSASATSTFAGGLTIETSGFVYDYFTGNIGLGTTSPSKLLSVQGDTLISGTSFFGGAITATSSLMVTGATSTIAWLSSTYSTSTNATSTNLFATNANFTNSTSTFAFFTTASSTNLFAQSGTVGTFAGITGTFAGTLGVTGLTTLGNASTTQIGSTGSAYFATTGGSVGVGTTSPSRLFAVHGNSYISGTSFFGGALTATSTLDISGVITSTATAANVFPYASSTALSVSGTGYFGTASTTNLTVSALSTTRIPFLTTAGAFTDDSDLTFTNGNLLTATYASTTAISSTGGAWFATSGGNVGIGTTTPNWKLSVAGQGSFDDYVRASYFTATSTTATSTFSGGLRVGTNALTVLQSGAVGIGTTSPSLFDLTVSGLGIVLDNGQGISWWDGVTGNSSVSGTATLITASASTHVNLNSTLYATGATPGNRVGIGTTTPNNKLTIFSASTPALEFAAASAAGANWTMGIDTADGMKFKIASSTAVGTSARLTIDTNGNVGIATTSPSQTFAVQGNSYISGTSFFGGAITATSSLMVTGATSTIAWLSSVFSTSTNATSTNLFSTNATFTNATSTFSFATTASSTNLYSLAANLGTLGLTGIITSTAATANVLPYASSTALSVSGTGYFSTASTTNLTVSALTSTRIPFLTTAGAFTDDGDLTFTSGNLLTATYASTTMLTSSQGATFATVSGNVGIGTTSPTQMLSVSSSGGNSAYFAGRIGIGTNSPSTDSLIHSNASAAGYQQRWTTPNATGYLYMFNNAAASTAAGLEMGVLTNHRVDFVTNSLNRMTIEGSGNVGIGTTGPLVPLDVQSNSSGDALILRGRNNGVVDESGLYFRHNDGTTNHGFIIGQSTRLDLAGGSTVAMSLASTGNVGIGTTSPFTKLTIQDDSNTGLHISSKTSNAVLEFGNDSVGKARIGIPTSANGIITGTAASDLAIRGQRIVFSGDAGTTAHMVIQNGGNVGIGTTGPDVKLTVSGATDGLTDGKIKLKSNKTGWGDITGMLMTTAGGSTVLDGLTMSVDSGFIALSPGGGEAVRILNSGNVGIGTTGPGVKLDVVGSSLAFKVTTGNDINQAQFGRDSANGIFILGNTVTGGASRNWQISNNFQSGAAFHITPSTANAGTTFSTPALTILDGGNVGIGTTGPLVPLDVQSNSSGDALILRGRNNGVVDESGLYFRHNDGTTNHGFIIGQSTRLDLAGGSTVAMSLASTGNVGIGTTSPAYPLTVRSASDALFYLSAASQPRLLWYSETSKEDMSIQKVSTAGGGLRILDNGGNNVRVTFTDGGNVGIGTTTPSAKLSVTGSGTGTGRAFALADSNNVEHVEILDNGKVVVKEANIRLSNAYFLSGNLAAGTEVTLIGRNAADRVSIDPDGYGTVFAGNVGIGTTSPGTLLGVHGSGLFSSNLTVGGTLTATSTVLLATTAGNVGIGTTTPGSVFAIKDTQDSAFTSGISIARSANSQTGYINMVGGAFNFNVDDGLPIRFRDGGTVNMSIMSDGNVGIGTVSPATGANLHVAEGTGAATSGDTGLIIGNMNTASERGAGIGLFATNAAAGGADYDDIYFAHRNDAGTGEGPTSMISSYKTAGANTSDLRFNYGTGVGGANTEAMRISTGGNVGIGTTSPWAKLAVEGTVSFKSLTTATTGNYLCHNTTSNEITSGTTCSLSSERYKENISDISYGLDAVRQLRPVSFNYRPEYNIDGGQVGFISEEMVTVIPEVVVYDSDGRVGGIDYGKLTAVLSNAIQELDARDTTFAASLATATSSISAVQDQIATAVMFDAEGNVGLGTTTPDYKLHVIGDVAATSFVNISTRDAKKNIDYLDEGDKVSVLERIKNIGIATYNYTGEVSNAPKRLGLIAEESPAEILSANGKGVDVYKLSTFILAGVQEQQKRIEALELKMARIEGIVGSLSTSTATTTALTGGGIIEALGEFGASVVENVIHFATLAIDTAFAKTITVENTASVGALTVGSAEKRSGITLYDEATGSPYCLKIVNGSMASAPGVCPTVVASGNTVTVTTPGPATGGASAAASPAETSSTSAGTASTPEETAGTETSSTPEATPASGSSTPETTSAPGSSTSDNLGTGTAESPAPAESASTTSAPSEVTESAPESTPTTAETSAPSAASDTETPTTPTP